MNPLVVALTPSTRLSDRQFYDLCRANPDLKIERTAVGDLLFMPPTDGETGNRNAKLISRFVVWSEATQQGEVFDSSTGFKLPNGADRSPDVAWVRRDRWEALPPEDREKFPPIAPDFVLELMSPSDSLAIAHPPYAFCLHPKLPAPSPLGRDPPSLSSTQCSPTLGIFHLYRKPLKVRGYIAVFAGVRYGETPVTLIQQGVCCPASDQEPLYRSFVRVARE